MNAASNVWKRKNGNFNFAQSWPKDVYSDCLWFTAGALICNSSLNHWELL